MSTNSQVLRDYSNIKIFVGHASFSVNVTYETCETREKAVRQCFRKGAFKVKS